MNLRTKAIIFFGLLLLSIVFVDVFYVQYGVRDTFVNQTTSNFRIIAEQTESAYLSYSDQMKTRAVDWSSDATLRNIIRETLASQTGTREHTLSVDKFAKYVRENKMLFAKSIILAEVLDKDGVIVASTEVSRIGQSDVDSGPSRYKQQFVNAISSDLGTAFVVSAVFDENVSPEVTSRVLVRIFGPNGEGVFSPVDGVLVLHYLNTQDIISALNGSLSAHPNRVTYGAFLDNYQTSEIFLVNSDHIVVTPMRDGILTDYSKIPKQKIDSVPIAACLDEGREVNQEYNNAQGVRVLGASMCLEDRGVVLIVEVEDDEVFAPLNALIGWTTLGVLILFIFGLVIVVFFVRWPLVHLDEIIKALEKVMKGDLNVVVKIDSNDETGRLARMFNTMIDSIRKNQQALEESSRLVAEKATFLEKDLIEHQKQEKFLEESKRATLNLLEDSWKAKEKLEEEGNKLQTILSSIGDGLVLLDNEYKVVLVNTKALELFGMKDENLVGQNIHKIVKLQKNRKNVETNDWPIEEVFRSKKTITTTIEDRFSITTKGLGMPLPVAFSVAPISGRFSGVVIVMRDVTADREFDEAKSGFISVASHQLRTPLTSIRWYSEMLLSEDTGSLNDSQKDFVSEIHGGAERLYKTVDLLLGLSRIEGGRIRVEKVPINIGTLTTDIVKEVTSQVNEKELTLTVVPPEGAPVTVWLDSLLLRQVLLNLVSNAINYTNNKGTIEISWRLTEDTHEVLYSVRDTGIGIPENQTSRIFSKFFRAENARMQVPDGSGLGLALVKNLVESWGGRIWFKSEKDVGSTFFFTIPLTTPVETKKENDITIKQ